MCNSGNTSADFYIDRASGHSIPRPGTSRPPDHAVYDPSFLFMRGDVRTRPSFAYATLDCTYRSLDTLRCLRRLAEMPGGGTNCRKHGFAGRRDVAAPQLLESAESATGNSDGKHIAASISLGQRGYAKPEPRLAFFQQLMRRLQFGPGVSSVAVSNSLPPAGGGRSFYSDLVVPGRPPLPARTGGMITSRLVSPGYFRSLDIPILQGRSFTEEEQNSNENLVILSKQLAARLFPGKNPIGEHCRWTARIRTLPGTRSLALPLT